MEKGSKKRRQVRKFEDKKETGLGDLLAIGRKIEGKDHFFRYLVCTNGRVLTNVEGTEEQV